MSDQIKNCRRSNRQQTLEKLYSLIESGHFQEAMIYFPQVYLGGEEYDPDLVLRFARFLIDEKDFSRARDLLVRHCSLFIRYANVLSAASFLAEVESSFLESSRGRKVKIAVLSDVTTTYFVKIFEFYLKSSGIAPQIYEASYGQVESEIFRGDSDLYGFNPDILIILSGGRGIGIGGYLGDVEGFIGEKISRLRALWDEAHRRCGCQVLQGNFPADPWIPAPNAGGSLPGGRLTALRLLNARLPGVLPSYVSLLDFDELASEYGRWGWWDNRYYYAAKVPFALGAVPAAAALAAALIRDLLGLAPKCAVIDLDNTIWGGILGEVGASDLELGPTSEGEPYLDIQRYLKELRDNGFLLAVCSKNDPDSVREVFEKHEHMVLRPGDIAAWRVNWNPKPVNLQEIAEELSLGLESFVFLDDNPVEREEVRKTWPEVRVPVLPADPGGYVETLVRSRIFEKARLSEEDCRRADLYRQRKQAEEFRASARTHEEFLSGLEMESRVEYFSPVNIDRIHQLINKTNQFNLTTKRMAMPELEEAVRSQEWICLAFHLEDRYGKHGLVGILLGRIESGGVEIENFLMSCRVIGRGLEKAMLQVLAKEARRRGLAVLRGKFVPSLKNSLVGGLYDKLGFQLVGDEAGVKNYIFRLPERGGFEDHYLRLNWGKDGANDEEPTGNAVS